MTMLVRLNTATAVALGILLAAIPAPARAYEHQTLYVLTQHAIDEHIVPRFQVFRAAAGTLAAEATAFCSAPTDTGRARLKERFADAVLAWAGAEYLRMGPASDAGRHERIAFWPDPRGVMERQLRPVLASRDQALLAPGGLARQSAALQGLPAFEWLLADEAAVIGAPTEDGKYCCALATAIAANVAAIAAEIVTEWSREDGWRQRMLRPGSDNPTYHSASEAAAEIAKSLLTGLQLMLEAQVKPRLEAPKEGRTKTPGLPYRKVKLSEAYLLAGLQSAEALYTTAKLDSYLTEDKENVRKLIATGFETIMRQVSAEAAVAKAAAEPTGQRPEAWKPVAFTLAGVRRAIATQVLPAAEISLGFNELDGD